MNKIIKNFINGYNSREVRKVMPIVKKIKALDREMSRYTDGRLREMAGGLGERLQKGQSLDDILIEAFALVREASFRVLGVKYNDVQIASGIILHQGRVAKMKDGEGEKVISVLPTFLNALTGKGVHVITSNEYLAKRDCEEIGKIYEFLGLTTGVILHHMKREERREIYNRDIVYGISSEIGFDYLKDNMVEFKADRFQRGLNYAIIDEIDSILIDNATAPLIISGGSTKIVGDEGKFSSRSANQVIEPKEVMGLQKESKTMTIERFFKSYNKLCGMSKTINTNKKQFKDMYSLNVIAITANKFAKQ